MRYRFIFLPVMALILPACLKQENPVCNGDVVPMILEVGADVRTCLEDGALYWRGEDCIGVSNGSSNHSFANDNPSSFSRTTTFSGAAEPGVSLYAYYPYSAEAVEADKVSMAIPQVQYPLPGTFDGVADVMVSRPFVWNGTPVSLNFARIGAIVKLELDDKTGLLKDQNLKSLSLAADVFLSGNISVPMDNPEQGVVVSGSKQVLAHLSDSYPTDNPVYFVTLPQILKRGSKLQIDALTEAFRIHKDVTLQSSEIVLGSGVVTTIRVTFGEENIVPSERIKIDFGKSSNKGETPSDWNKITAYTVLAPVDLHYENGTASSLQLVSMLDFNEAWGGSTGEQTSWIIDYPEYTMPTCVWCDGLRITGTKGQGDRGPAKVVLGGFRQDACYDFDLIAFRYDGTKSARECRYVIQGAQRSVVKTIFPGMNRNGWNGKGDIEDYRVKYKGIQADERGFITIEVTGIDTGTAVDGLLNAVVITENDDLLMENEPEVPQTRVTTVFAPERTKLLKNPMSGWAVYAGLGSGLINNFWEVYDNFPSSKGNIRVSDYASVLLIRMKWSEIEPQEGLYAWDPRNTTDSAKRYRMLVEGAKSRGLKIVPSFRFDSRDLDVDAVPSYLKTKGAKGFTSGSKNVWTPYPDDPVFQACLKKMLQALATQINDPEIGGYIQGFGIGLWGEYHSCIYSTGDESPREDVLNWMCDTFMEVFDNIPVVVNYHRMIGSGKKEGTPDSRSASLLAGAYAKGLCFGSGAFGMTQYYSDWEKIFIAGYRYKVPVTMEGGWITGGTHRYWNDPSGKYREGHPEDVRLGEFEDGMASFVNVMDMRYNSNYKNSETYSWFNYSFDLVERFISEGVYRIYPTQITYPDCIENGKSFTMASKWTNLGWSYCPVNVAQYAKRYKVAYALLDTSDKVASVAYDPEADPSKWYLGVETPYESEIVFNGAPAGSYTLAVAIVDILKNNKPGIQLSTLDSCKTTEGWVKIGKVLVR